MNMQNHITPKTIPIGFNTIEKFYYDYCTKCEVWKQNGGLDPKVDYKRSVCISRACPHDFADLFQYLKSLEQEIRDEYKK